MKLKRLEVNAFAGISPNSPVVIDFSESKFVKADGDNGVGKTSLLNALLVACGQLSHTGKEGKNFINLDSDKIDINFEFIGKDRYNYWVRCTKSRFELTYDGEAVPEPITKMKELLGVVGVSPMEIKNAKVSDIVKWLSSYTNVSAEDFEKEMDKHKANIKLAQESRAAANRQMKALNEFLNSEEMFNKWEESEKTYTKKVDITALSAQLQKARNNSNQYLVAETKVDNYLKQKKELEDEIARLNTQLEGVQKNLDIGLDWMEKNKSFKTDYDAIKKQYDNAAADIASYNKWQEIKTKKAERDEFETVAQKADANEKNILKKVTELQTSVLPDIKGVELFAEDTHDNGTMKKAGLYWNGKNAAQLSESEWWTLVLEIWRKYRVKVIVIDNFSSLGSMAVDILKKLVKDGAYVLAAEMNREQKTLEISYADTPENKKIKDI